MVPPKPRRRGAQTLEDVIADSLKTHRGKLLMDCRWYCVCGWTSPREGEGGNHAAYAEQQGRDHQAQHIAKALAEQARAEEETP